MPHTLSIVIPSHNRPDLLRDCLISIQNAAPPGTEIIVVDDGSPAQCVSQTAHAFPGVTVLRLPRQRGFCVAVNAGLRIATGTIVAILNDDTTVTPGWANSALTHFDNPTIGAVTPLVLLHGVHPERIDSTGDTYSLGGIARKRFHGRLLSDGLPPAGPVFGASGSSSCYRRQLLRDAGGFPESFGAYFDDVDVSFRLRRAGADIVFEPAARVYHRVGASHGPPNRRLLWQQSRNEERVFWRNLPAIVLPETLPRHLVVLAAKAWRRSDDGTFWPFFWGRVAVLAEVPELLRHRRWLRTLGPPSWCWQTHPWWLYFKIEKYLRLYGPGNSG